MMGAKNVKFGDAGLDKLVEGINVVANAVKVRHPFTYTYFLFSEEGTMFGWGVGLWVYVCARGCFAGVGLRVAWEAGGTLSPESWPIDLPRCLTQTRKSSTQTQ